MLPLPTVASSPAVPYTKAGPHNGRLAQLVRAPALQAGCRGFESLTAHQNPSKTLKYSENPLEIEGFRICSCFSGNSVVRLFFSYKTAAFLQRLDQGLALLDRSNWETGSLCVPLRNDVSSPYHRSPTRHSASTPSFGTGPVGNQATRCSSASSPTSRIGSGCALKVAGTG